MIKVDFSNAKVGDRAWSIQLGECEIVDIDDTLSRPIVVNKTGTQEGWFYYKDGRDSKSDAYPTLFHS